MFLVSLYRTVHGVTEQSTVGRSPALHRTNHHLLLGARRAAKNRWSGWSARRSLVQASAACARDAASCRSRHPGVHAAPLSLYDAIANVGSHIAATGAVGLGPCLPAPESDGQNKGNQMILLSIDRWCRVVSAEAERVACAPANCVEREW